MSVVRVQSASFQGIEAYPVEVEVDVSLGLPRFTVVGLPDQAVKESKERVRAAIKNSGFPMPSRKITVNLAPADVKKEGPAFDLAMALGILAATEVVPRDALRSYCFLGELALDGTLRKIRGAIVLANGLRKKGQRFVLPRENFVEASLEKGVEVLAAGHLREVVELLQGKAPLPHPETPDWKSVPPACDGMDFAEVKGHAPAKRAIEIAVAGGHNLLITWTIIQHLKRDVLLYRKG